MVGTVGWYRELSRNCREGGKVNKGGTVGRYRGLRRNDSI